MLRRDPVQPRQIGQPYQQQRRIADELLLAGQLRQPRLALGLLHRDHAPELQIGRGGRGLCRGDQQLQRPIGQRARQEPAHRAVAEDGLQHLVPLRRRGKRTVTVAPAQQRVCVGGRLRQGACGRHIVLQIWVERSIIPDPRGHATAAARPGRRRSMTIYTGPVFDMARQQFQVIADYLEIPHDERARLLYPKRAIAVSCPIHRDDGSIAVYQGYRVQHHLTLGPDQGRHALRAQRRYRRGGGAGDLDELEMRARRPALWRRQGRRHRRSARAVAPRAGEPVAPLHAGDDPVRRPAHRRDGARHGHQRAGHGVVHGHLFHVPGPDRDRDRHRQAGRIRRHRGQARSDRPRRRLSGRARAGAHRPAAGRRHRDHAGLRQCRQLRRGDTGRSAA